MAEPIKPELPVINTFIETPSTFPEKVENYKF
jgi:hypothetical protein